MWSLNSLGSRVTRYRYHITDKTHGARDSVRATSDAAAIHCPTTLTARSSPALGYPRADSGGHRWPGSAGRGAARTDAQHPSVVRPDARVAAPLLTATLGPANSASLTAVRPPLPPSPPTILSWPVTNLIVAIDRSSFAAVAVDLIFDPVETPVFMQWWHMINDLQGWREYNGKY